MRSERADARGPALAGRGRASGRVRRLAGVGTGLFLAVAGPSRLAAEPATAAQLSPAPGVALDLRLGESLNHTMLEAPEGDLGLTGTHRATATRRDRALPVAWAAHGERVQLNGADVQLSAFGGRMKARSSLAIGETEAAGTEDGLAAVRRALDGRPGPDAGSATRTDLQALLPAGDERTLDLALSQGRMKPGALADDARQVTDRETFAMRSWLRGKAWAVGARGELEGNNASGASDLRGVRRHRRRVDGELQLRPLWGKPGQGLAPWLPATLQVWGELEDWETQRPGAGGIEIGQAVGGLEAPQLQQQRTEAGLVWPSGLRASLRETVHTDPRDPGARAPVFDDLELARGFQGEGWRCSLRGIATTRADGPPYEALRLVGDVTVSGWGGLSFRGLADSKMEEWAGGSRQRLRLEFGLDFAGLLAQAWPAMAPDFLEASSLFRMGGHADPEDRLTAVEDSQLRLVGGWRF